MNKKSSIRITTAAFAFEMEDSEGLKATSWQNKLSEKTLILGGGPELEVEVDAARARIWIEGWHWRRSDKESVSPDEESGFKQGWHLPEHPDIQESSKEPSDWASSTNLLGLFDSTTYWGWGRTRFFLPEELAGEPLTFTLGGLGIGDFRQKRVFVNGSLIGERTNEGRWFEPAIFELRPTDPQYSSLRFGQVNILALQLGGSINRSLRLDESDPDHAFHWPYPHLVAPAFFQHIEVGEFPVQKLTFVMESRRDNGPDGGIGLTLAAKEVPIKAELTYQPSKDERTLIKTVTLINGGNKPVRIMNVSLGDYQTGTSTSEGDMGFPVHVEESYFLSLDHPAGYAMGADGRIQLRQFSGTLLPPQTSYSCMTAVLGVSEAGASRKAFLDHLHLRMRRVRRGHDKPLAIASMFGGWKIPAGKMLEDEISENVCLHHAEWLQQFQRKTGEAFDLISVDFWQDPTADLTKFNRHFPQGFDASRKALTATGAKHGLWIDSSLFAKWHIGRNPLTHNCLAGQASYAANDTERWGYAPMCRAAEPLRTIFKNAFLHHIQEGGARLLKFDNLVSVCHNQNHGHWPGVYSTETIYNSVIEFFSVLDQACPDVFLMLYWGYRSPWWLLYGDVLFECGLKIEAASPSPSPSLHARDGVTLTLDQGTAYSADMPGLGKDSLGVWLSRWPWNSSIGKERWREGLIMDMCRGNLLFQPWMGEDDLDDQEMDDMADLLRLLRLRSACFRNSRPILGDPWRNEPYGYVCSDGERSFLAASNFSWNDLPLRFDDTKALGFEVTDPVTVFRHYPEPAKLTSLSDCLRPFQVALYELVPIGGEPTSEKSFSESASVEVFSEPSRAIEVEVIQASADIGKDEKTVLFAGVYDAIKESTEPWHGSVVSGQIPASKFGGILVVCLIASQDGKAIPTGSMGSFFRAEVEVKGATCAFEPVLADKTYPSTWQAWRISVPATTGASFDLKIASRLPGDVCEKFSSHFIPNDYLTI